MSGKKRVYFRLSAPDAREVAVVGSFSGWQEIRPLKKSKAGVWQTWINLEPGEHEYRFLVDGSWVDDPVSAHRVPNDFGTENSVVIVEA